MNKYDIRVHTIDKLYIDYMVEAENSVEASVKAKKLYFEQFPGADKKIYTQMLIGKGKVR